MLDTDLAARLGMERPTNIRAVIEKNRAELEAFGPCTGRVHAHPTVPGRTSTAFYLNEEQATLVVMFSRTPKAAEARREIIQVFTAWRRGELEQSAPQPALPDFSNQVLMARAWADQLEQRLLAQATVVVQAAEIEALTLDIDKTPPGTDAINPPYR